MSKNRLSVCAVAACYLSALAAYGQSAVKPFSVLSPFTTLQPSVVVDCVAGDFNGDGKADVAMLSYAVDSLGQPITPNGTALSVFIGKGDGSFQSGLTVATFPVAGGQLNVGDFNGDGKLDIAVVSGYPSTAPGALSVFLGKGDGTFGSPLVNTSPVDPTKRVLVADMNRDGKLDLIVGGPFSSGGGVVLLGKGDGTFQSPLGLAGYALIVTDFNGDGIPDLVTTNISNVLSVLIGRGDGTFLGGATIAGVTTTEYIVAGDLNGDGKADLVVASGPGGGVGQAIPGIAHILFGNGDGTFQAPSSLTGLGGALLAVDLNQDGKLDLVWNYSVMLGNGDGTFGSPYYLATPSYNCEPTAAIAGLPYNCGTYELSSVAADVNGDGLPDLVTVGPQPAPIHFYSTASLLSSFINDSPGDGFLAPGISATGGTGVSTIPGGATYAAVVTARGPGFAIGQNSLVTAYGVNLAPATASASGPPFPTALGGISLHIGGALAQLLYVSPTQINYLSPPGPFLDAVNAYFANPAIFVERIGMPFMQKGLVLPMAPDVPGLFAVDSGGTAAATAVRVAPNGAQTPVPVFDCSTSPCTAVPIDLSGDPVYLSLYGTGFDYSASEIFVATVTCRAGLVAIGKTVYAGPQGSVTGLNQINVLLANTGAGIKNVSCEMVLTEHDVTNYVIDVTSNPVQISIK